MRVFIYIMIISMFGVIASNLYSISIHKQYLDDIKKHRKIISEYEIYKSQYPWLTKKYYTIMKGASYKTGVPIGFGLSLIQEESNGKEKSTNKKSLCAGLMQIHPCHKVENVYDPEININFGMAYFAQILKINAHNNYSLALSMYHCGPYKEGAYTDFKYCENIMERVLKSYVMMEVYDVNL
jgi:soluble lytic murein transglycosylase-like protein